MSKLKELLGNSVRVADAYLKYVILVDGSMNRRGQGPKDCREQLLRETIAANPGKEVILALVETGSSGWAKR